MKDLTGGLTFLKNGLSCLCFLYLCWNTDSVTAQSWNWAEQKSCANRNAKVTPNPDGTFFFTGVFKDTMNIGNQTLISQSTGWDMFLSKFDATNNLLWVKSFGGDDAYSGISSIEGFSIAVDSWGNILMSGSFAGTFIVNSDTLRSVNNWQDAFLAKCDSSGNFIWVKHLAARAAEGFGKIFLDHNDNISVNGGYIDYDALDTLVYMYHEIPTDTFIIPFTRYVDGYIFRFDPDGHVLGMNYWNGPEDEQPFSAVMDDYGSIYFRQTIDSMAIDGNDTIRSYGKRDIVIRKINSAGQKVWTKHFGNVNDDAMTMIKVMGDRIFIYGTIDSVTTLGSQTITSSGYLDVYCAWMDTSGEITSIRTFGGDTSSISPYIVPDVNEAGDIFFPAMPYGTIAFDTVIVTSSFDNFTNVLLIMDSAFHIKRVIRSSDLGHDLYFGVITCTNSGAIVYGAFADSATFSGNVLIEDTSCTLNHNFIASLNFTNSIDELKSIQSALVYPNPSSGNFDISFNVVAAGNYSLVINTVLGDQVHVEKISSRTGENVISLKLNDRLEPGIYFVTISNSLDERKTCKLIIQ